MGTTQQRAELDAIIRKAKALINLKDHPNTSPEEAAAAASRLQALMTRYNLDVAAVSAPDASEYEAQDYDLNSVKAGNVGWRRVLMAELCATNFCRTISRWSQSLNRRDLDERAAALAEEDERLRERWMDEDGNLKPRLARGGAPRRGIPQVMIVGERHNIEMVVYLYEYLAREIVRLGREAHVQECHRITRKNIERKEWDRVLKVSRPMQDHPEWRGYLNSFAAGAVEVIAYRLRERYRQDVAETEPARTAAGGVVTGQELVVIKDQALTEATIKYAGTSEARSTEAPISNEDARKAGRLAGARVNLNRPLEERRTGATMLPEGK
jgi:hypothetical protein